MIYWWQKSSSWPWRGNWFKTCPPAIENSKLERSIKQLSDTGLQMPEGCDGWEKQNKCRPHSPFSIRKGASGTLEQEREPLPCVQGSLGCRHQNCSLGAGRLRQQTPSEQRTREGEATQGKPRGAPFGSLLTCTWARWDLKRLDEKQLPGKGQLQRHCRQN